MVCALPDRLAVVNDDSTDVLSDIRGTWLHAALPLSWFVETMGQQAMPDQTRRGVSG
jgi:hypothetical protein